MLQIENELYASIRPKRVQQANETPSQALNARGIEYIEIRSLDVNPFCKLGITQEQVNFLDLFLTWCAIKPSAEISALQSKYFAANLNAIVTEGRNPALQLDIDGKSKSVAQWGEWLTDELKELAVVLDDSGNEERYKEAIAHIAPRFKSPELTSSARILDHIIEKDSDNGPLALELSKQYKKDLIEQPYQIWSDQYFESQKSDSIIKQQKIEQSDNVDFDEFLKNYFIHSEKA